MKFGLVGFCSKSDKNNATDDLQSALQMQRAQFVSARAMTDIARADTLPPISLQVFAIIKMKINACNKIFSACRTYPNLGLRSARTQRP
jgi:hypothetical protein